MKESNLSPPTPVARTESLAVLVKRVLLMGGSTAVRLGAGVIAFVWMARALGVGPFGVFMLWLSVATLVALAGNFGFATYLLREVGAQPERAVQRMSEVLTAKLCLSVILMLAVLVGAWWVPSDQRLLLLVLSAVQIADTFSEVLVVGLRARGLFALDARLTTLGAAIQIACIGVALSIQPSTQAALAGYALARTAVLGINMAAVLPRLPGVQLVSVGHAFACLRSTRAFAVDVLLQSLMGQVDSVVLNAFSGPHVVGIYQAGLRVFNGLAQVAPVLANVLLPTVAAAHAKGHEYYTREARRVQWAFSGAGLVMGLLLAWPAQVLVVRVFGLEFASLRDLLPWFGLLFFVRMFAASWGVLLTAGGQQGYRARCNVTMWAVIAMVASVATPAYGPCGWLLALVLGHAVLAVLYMRRAVHQAGGHWSQPVAGFVCLTGFLPTLRLEKLL